MPSLPSVAAIIAPAHLFAYSTLLGTQLYQSFVMVKVAYQALPPEAFTTLQKRVFPVYFFSQSALIGVTAITFPHGPLALVKSKGDWIPFAVAMATAILNTAVYGPRTSRLMMIRRTLANRCVDAVESHVGAKEMDEVKRAFSRNHAMSIHLNLVTIGATLWYGWRLASKLDFGTI